MIQIIAVVGFVLSFYALVEHIKINKSSKYRSVCDISDDVSCSKAFGSKYGKTFGVPNPVGGLFFYAAVFLLSAFQLNFLLIAAVSFSLAFSLYLAYVLYFKIRSICVVCTAIYLVNLLLFLAVLF